MTKPIPENKLLWEILPELESELESLTVKLIAALSAPFPHERWRNAKRMEPEEIIDWGNNVSRQAHYDRSFWALAPWREVASRIQHNPPDESYRMLRTFVTMLTVAETFASPFMYLGTLITIHPMLNALSAYFGEVRLFEEEPPAGSWADNFDSARAHLDELFDKVLLPEPPNAD